MMPFLNRKRYSIVSMSQNNKDAVAMESTLSLWPARWEKTKSFIVKNYLPIAFLLAMGLSLAWPVPGRFLANVSILGNVRICQVASMMLVFLITGLQLNTTEMKQALALRNLPVVVYGFVAILVITPCLGFALRAVPLHPWEFASGLAIFCVAPTTLGVGVALTEACGGNRALALLLTVGTNALAVFTMPPELRLLLSQGHGTGGGGVSGSGPGSLNMHVQVTDLLAKLAVTVLVPFTVGKVVREVLPTAEAFAKTHRVPLSMLSTTALAFVVWQTLSAARDLLLAQQPGPVMAILGLTVAMHLAYLLGNYLVVRWVLWAPLREAIAVVIMASQKSAPVAVTTLTFMTRDAAQQGLLSLPSIVGQLVQIFMGAAIANWLSAVVERSTELEKVATAVEESQGDGEALAQGHAQGAVLVELGVSRHVARPGDASAAVTETTAAADAQMEIVTAPPSSSSVSSPTRRRAECTGGARQLPRGHDDGGGGGGGGAERAVEDLPGSPSPGSDGVGGGSGRFSPLTAQVQMVVEVDAHTEGVPGVCGDLRGRLRPGPCVPPVL